MTDVDEHLPPLAPAPTATSMPSEVRVRPPRMRRRRMRLPWLRGRITREKFVEWLKTMVWVVPLTIIIWIYAEREQIVPSYTIDTPVQVITTDQNQYVEVSSDTNHFVENIGGPPPTITLRLTGPQEGLEKVRDALSTVPPALQIDLGSSVHPGPSPQRINIASRIDKYDLFRAHGVSVLETTPPELLVLVDDVMGRKLDVQLPPGLANVDTAATTIEPRQVTVRGPTRLLGSVSVFADVAKLAATLRPGVHVLNDVPLLLGQRDERITIMPPAKVTVRLSVQAADESLTLPNPVPVYIKVTQTLQQSYDIKWDPASLTDVKVTGPHDRIEELRQEEAKGGSPVQAVLELNSDDIGHSPKAVTFTLPEGVHTSPDSTGRTVNFTLTPRGG